MKNRFLAIALFVFTNIFAQNIETQYKYGAYIVKPTLENIVYALLDSQSFKSKITSTYEYTLERDGNYFAPTRIGAPYYSIGLSYSEIQMIWTDDEAMNSIAKSELRRLSSPQYSNGFYYYGGKLKNGRTIVIAFKPDSSGGSLLANLR